MPTIGLSQSVLDMCFGQEALEGGPRTLLTHIATQDHAQ